MRPKEDREVMDRVRHIPVKAGAAVFWDNRIPHANAYRHEGEVPRSVVYSSFLPDIALNREYVRQQLANWKVQRPPTDQWIEIDDESTDKDVTHRPWTKTNWNGTVAMIPCLNFKEKRSGRP
jgi:hypothetical protein